MPRWHVLLVIALVAVAGGCRRYHMGRVRMPDGHIETRRLQPEQSIAISRATADLPCTEENLYVERVPRTTQFMVHGCGAEAAYVCVRLPRVGVLCDLEYVRPEMSGGGELPASGPSSNAPVQDIVAISPAPPPPSGSSRVRGELGDPRGTD